MGGNLGRIYAILFLRYPSYGIYPDEGKFGNENFMDSKGSLQITIYYMIATVQHEKVMIKFYSLPINHLTKTRQFLILQ